MKKKGGRKSSKKTLKHNHVKKKTEFKLRGDFKGAIIILCFTLLFFILLRSPPDEKDQEIQMTEEIENTQVEKDTDYLEEQLLSDNGLVKEGELQDERLEVLTGMSYKTFKDSIGLQSDVVIYMEDEEGNLIDLGEGVPCYGDPDAEIGGYKCSAK